MNRLSLTLALSAILSHDINPRQICRVTASKDEEGLKLNLYTDEAQTAADETLELDVTFGINNVIIFQAQQGFDEVIGDDPETIAQLYNVLHAFMPGDRQKKLIAESRKLGIVDVTYKTQVFVIAYNGRGGAVMKPLNTYYAVETEGDKLVMAKPGQIDTFVARDFAEKMDKLCFTDKAVTLAEQTLNEHGVSPIASIEVEGVCKLAKKFSEDGTAVIQVFGKKGITGELESNGEFKASPQALDVDTFDVAKSDGSGANAKIKRHQPNGDVSMELSAAA